MLFPLVGISAEEIYNFQVNFLLVPSLNLTMKISEPYYFQNRKVKKIEYIAKTNSLFSKIFSVDNIYESIYSVDDFSVLVHKKIIKQPNVQQNLVVIYDFEKLQAIYSNGKTVNIPGKVHSFFSMLMHLRYIPKINLEKIRLNIEIEGKVFEARFLNRGTEKINVSGTDIDSYKIEILMKNLTPGRRSVSPLTDIFYWKMGSEEGEKYIWLEKQNPHRIVKTKFSLSSTWLNAILVQDEK